MSSLTHYLISALIIHSFVAHSKFTHYGSGFATLGDTVN